MSKLKEPKTTLEPRPTTANLSFMREYQEGMKRMPHVLAGLGYDSLRPGQDKAVKSIMMQRDSVVILPTATGKSACFVVPTLCMQWRAIIIYPLIALMRDQAQSMQRSGLTAASISSQESDAHNMSVINDWASGELQFMLVSPERFANSDWANIVTQFPPDIVAMDECFTPDVEILTEDGFVTFGKLTGVADKGALRPKVAQVDPATGEITYAHPTKFINRHHSGEIIDVSNSSGIDLSMTPNHDLLVYRPDGSHKKRTAGDAKFSHQWRMRAAGDNCKGRDSLTVAERLQIAFQADGNAHSSSSAAFSFVRGRKIKRFLRLMKDGGFAFNEVKDQRSSRRRFIVTGVPNLKKLMRESLDYKQFSSRGCRLIVEEAIAWDGSEVSDTLGYYSSTVEDNTSYYQEVCIRAGLRARKTLQIDARKDTYKDVHRLFIRRTGPWVDTQYFKKTTRRYDGPVCCVEVPTGCIIVRREGKAVVVGNCHTFEQWADTFRHGYKICGEFIQKVQPKVVAAFSATLSADAENEVREGLGIVNADLIYHYPRRENLHLSTLEMEKMNDAAPWVARNCPGPTVVYASTRKRVEMYAASIDRYTDRSVYLYHGGMKQQDRRYNQDKFMEDPDGIIVATNAFGMGVDKPDIRNVIHFDIPGDLVALAQECVHPASMISTSFGSKLASEVGLGEKMVDFCFSSGNTSEAETTEVMKNEASQLMEIRTKLGSTMRVTPNHPVYVLRDDFLVEVPAGSLVSGDKLLAKENLTPVVVTYNRLASMLLDCPEDVYVKVDPSLMVDVRRALSARDVSDIFGLKRDYDYNDYKNKKRGKLRCWVTACSAAGLPLQRLWDSVIHYKTRSSNVIILPEFFNEDLAWFMGIMATAGNIQRYKPKDGAAGYGAWCVRLGNTNVEIVDKFSRVCESLGLHVYRSVREPNESNSLAKLPLYNAECSSPILVHLCNKAGVTSVDKTYTVSVPPWLRLESESIRSAYLAGVIDGDGSISNGRYSVRFHSAGWSYLSDVAMMLRGLSIPSSCYPEDYLCKRDVMISAVDHGYSLLVSSTEKYEKLRDCLSPYSCKDWLPTRQPNAGQDMTAQRKSRKVKFVTEGKEWLVDVVTEVQALDYEGIVYNWRVDPGHQLVVDGLLTHNCGRAGRDGKDSRCTIIPTPEGIRTRRHFIRCGNPTPADVKAFFKAAESMREGPRGPIMAKRDEIANKAGVDVFAVQAIMTFCLGERIFAHDEKAARQQRVRFAENITSMTPTQRETRDHIYDIAVEKDGWWNFDLEALAEECSAEPSTVMARVRKMFNDGILDWVKATTSKPLQVIRRPEEVPKESFDRLAVKAAQAEADLQQVLQYCEIPDDEKHDFLESYLNRR